MKRTHLAIVAGAALRDEGLELEQRAGQRRRSSAAVGDSAPGEDTAVARHVNGLQGQLAKRGPLHPGRSEVGPDPKSAVEVRTVDAPPAADVALINSQFVEAELGRPAAGRAGWH